jgi:putative ABC transport system permease protein
MPWWRRRSDADFAEEIRAHLALEQDALAREGLSERDASALAHRAFGNLISAQEQFHESQHSRVVERMRQDLGGAARRLRRSPGFVALATLTLALGIGLSTAVFTVANAALLRRMPVVDQNRLMLLWGESQDGKGSRIPLTLDEVRAFQRQSRSIEDAAFFEFRGAVPAPVRSNDRVFPIRIGLVSGNFFELLGARAAIGRALRPEDDIPGAAPVVVLSHRAWQQDFGGDS